MTSGSPSDLLRLQQAVSQVLRQAGTPEPACEQVLALLAEACTARDAREAALLAATPDCFVTIDADGLITEFNPAAETTFGYTRAEALGHRMADLIVPPHLREAHFRGFARYLATRASHILGHRIEITAMRKDGSEFPVELTITTPELPGPPNSSPSSGT